jgi:hypothetical protein
MWIGIGVIDIAKDSFQVCGVNPEDVAMLR